MPRADHGLENLDGGPAKDVNTGQKLLLAVVGFLLLNLLLLIVFGDRGLVDLTHLRDRRDTLRSQNREIAAENLRLNRSVHRLRNDPAYVEHMARQELGMVAPGEIVLKVAPARHGDAPPLGKGN